jgi:hypothetical protein
MVRGGGARQRFRSTFLEPRLDREPLCLHLGEIQILCPFPGDDDEVDSMGEERRRPFAKALAAEPLDAVSAHGTADLASHHQAEPRRTRRGRLRGHEQRKMTSCDAAALALLAHELRVSTQPAVAPKLERHYFL